MTLQQALTANLSQRIKGLGIREAAKRLGTGRKSIVSIRSGHGNMKLATVERIASTLGIDPLSLLTNGKR